jgi:hypothetical protein
LKAPGKPVCQFEEHVWLLLQASSIKAFIESILAINSSSSHFDGIVIKYKIKIENKLNPVRRIYIMKSIWMKTVPAALIVGLFMLAPLATANEIIHDAEYVKSYNQYKTEWDKEDKALQKRLAALETKKAKDLILSSSCGMMRLMVESVTRC